MVRQTKFIRSATAVIATLLVSSLALALYTPFGNIVDIAKNVGFKSYGGARGKSTVKIAVLDNGFKGYKNAIGKYLPADTAYHAGPVAVDANAEEIHGLYMAEIISSLLAYVPGVSYELHLYSAFGYSNLEAAVKDVVASGVDIVLYSQVWEYGGNGDGRGFINKLINQALDKGVIWVNAAGNFGDGTFRTWIEDSKDDWIRLPGPNDTVRVRCEKGGKCPLRIVLSWNDFSDDVDAGTDKDLDLILTDDTLKIVGSSALQQMKKFPEGTPGASLYPREIINQVVSPGLYFIRVKNRSRNFKKNRDWLRLTVSGGRITLNDTTPGETLLPPADNPRVITVGASDTEKSSVSLRNQKPELVTRSLISLLGSNEEYKGSSNSAAITAAAAAILKAQNPGLSTARLVQLLGAAPAPQIPDTTGGDGRGLPLEVLGFTPTGNGCFEQTQLPYPRPVLQDLMSRTSGTVVATTRGLKVFTAVDPFTITGVQRVSLDDILVSGPRGFEALPRSNQEYLPPGFIEVVQTPRGQAICHSRNDETGRSTTGLGVGRRVRLP